MRSFVIHELVAVNTLLQVIRRVASITKDPGLESLMEKVMNSYWALRDIANRLGIPVWGVISPQFDWEQLDPERLMLAYVFAWAGEQDNPGDVLSALEAYREQRISINNDELRTFIEALRAIEVDPLLRMKYLDPGRQGFIRRAVIIAARKNMPGD